MSATTSAPSATKETIILEGFLKKKSPKTFLGRHPWQDRYFALWPHQLCYYKRKEDVGNEDACLGFLMVENMSGVATMMPDKSLSRFNLVLEGVERQFELNASSDAVARQWVEAVRDVLKRYGKKPISLAPTSPANGGGDRDESKFWKPKNHKRIQLQRRAAISAETGALTTDAKALASRRYEKSPDVAEMIFKVIRHNLAFQIMDDAALQQVVSLMWAQEFDKGQLVIAENQPAFLFSVVVSGALGASTSQQQHFPAPLDIHAEYAAADPLSPTSAADGGLASPVGGSTFWGDAKAGGSVMSGISSKYNTLSVSTLTAALNGPSPVASPMAASELLTRGHSFGEVALLYDTVSTHTITARQPTVVYTIERLQYKRLIAAASEKRFARRVDFLRTTTLLAQLPDQELKQIAEALEERRFARGELIIREGEPGDAFYIIVSGHARAYSRDGRELHVFTQPGEYFGERALIKNEQRGATVDAVTDVEVLFLTRRDFADLVGNVVETCVRGVRKYSLLNRELNLSVLSPTAGAFSFPEDTAVDTAAVDTAAAAAAGPGVSPEDDDVPPPPPLYSPPAAPDAAVTVAGTQSVGGIRMHFGGAADDTAAGDAPAAAAAYAPAPDRALPALPPTPLPRRPVCEVQSLADVRVLGTLGRGTFGHVQLVADKDDNTYALKAVNKAHIVSHNQIPHILNERAVMLELDHPFVVRLHRTLRDQNHIYFLLEPSMGGELFSVLRTREFFDAPTAQFYAAIVVSVFEYMHSKDTLYRDLKPENLLMDADGYLRVTDFGFAKKTRDRTYTFCGTPDYLAPEIVASAGHHTGADWWTLGILIYEMLAGYTPFYDDAGPTQMYSKILAGKVHFPPTFSPAAQHLISSLLQIKPTRRLGVHRDGASLIKKHDWFAGLDWDALVQKRLPPPIVVPVADKFDRSNFDAYPEQDGAEADYTPDPANPDWDCVF